GHDLIDLSPNPMFNTQSILLALTIVIAASASRADDASPKNAPGEVVLTFENVTVVKPTATWTAGDVTFSPASAPQGSKAQGRIMFFPHLKTDRKGIVNAM